jgi:hypothetical protein
MSHVTWTIAVLLAVIFALGKLAQAIGRRATAAADDLANPKFTTMAFAQLPPSIAGRLAGLRDQFIALGFREVATHTRQSSRMNYTCVLVAPDGITTAHVWTARASGLMLWLTPIMGWSAFKRELFASPRFGLMTHFPGARFIETSSIELLAKSHVEGEMEFRIMPETVPLAEMIEGHVAGAQAFATKHDTQPIPITDTDSVIACERATAVRVGEKLNRYLAERNIRREVGL